MLATFRALVVVECVADMMLLCGLHVAVGRSTRQVFDRLQQRLSPDELLEGNVTRTGSNPAVIRKAVSEANRRAAAGSKGTGNPQQCKSASNRFAGELVQALQVCDDIKQRHQQQMANHRLKDKVTAWGYKQHFVDNDDGFSFTCFQEFSIQLWAGACGDNLRPCLYFDATGGQVRNASIELSVLVIAADTTSTIVLWYDAGDHPLQCFHALQCSQVYPGSNTLITV